MVMHSIRRFANGLRKVAAGLAPFNESVWPGVRNDLFVAHESIYRFASTYAKGKDVLDAGCGTGYGTAAMAEVASAAVGVDLDARSIDYARRAFGGGNVRYETADLQALAFDQKFDVVVASNSLEHLDAPAKFFEGALRALRTDGVLIVAVPPIYSAHDAEEHSHIHYHRANLTVHEWHALLESTGLAVRCFSHTVRAGAQHPDFRANHRSVMSTDDFVFTPVPATDLALKPSITAIFVASKSASSSNPTQENL